MVIFATVGLPGSGKGEFARVAAEHGVPVVSMGDVIRAVCADRGVDPATGHGTIARALREEEGPTAVADRSVPYVTAALEDASAVVIDGLRSPAELAIFEEAFASHDIRLIAIEAPFELRAARLADRSRDETDVDTEALRSREAREAGFGMTELIDAADVTIANTGTLAALEATIETQLAAALDG
ncbi:MAG: AAA family ATPase [Haloquadratum sp.]|jgi:dephospho-CoA kinase|nr:AAA family ATPase [Haloferacaceae archaeon]MDR9444626.1 AAA family ATPase [Haloquadratum sp.]